MLELLDIRFSFFCRTTHMNKEGQHPIIFRLTFRNARRDLFTGLYCIKSDWDSNSSRVMISDKNAVAKNRNLDNILRNANNVFDALRFSREDFTVDELVSKLRGEEEEPELLINYLEKGKEGMKKRAGVEITMATYYKYKTSLEYMEEYLVRYHKVKNYTLKKITKEIWYYDYRTKIHHTLKKNPLKFDDLTEFIEC